MIDHAFPENAVVADFILNGPIKGSYLRGPFAPVDKEITAENLEVIGEIPKDLEGMFVRNSPNPKYKPKKSYHWFDGDGMLHGVHIQNGKATYRNRYVKTIGLGLENKKNRARYNGIQHIPNLMLPGKHSLKLKDCANTDVVFHAGQLLSLWWLSGDPYVISLPDLETKGIQNYSGELKRNMAAHSKVCPQTGELFFIDFDIRPPYLNYGVVSKEGKIKHYTSVKTRGYSVQHDLAITPNYSVLLDMPFSFSKAGLLRLKMIPKFEGQTRFGLIPRYGTNEEVKWFDVPATYILHTVNAHEEGDWVIVTACTIDDPIYDRKRHGRAPHVGILHPLGKFTRYKFNLKTGESKSELLDDVYNEFPTINNDVLGSKSRYSYHCRLVMDESRVLFDGLIKQDVESGSSKTHEYSKDNFGGEAAFAPRQGATAEDDGYLITFVYNAREHSSELHILDAQHIEQPPLARIPIPQRVPIGFHTCWISQKEIDNQRS